MTSTSTGQGGAAGTAPRKGVTKVGPRHAEPKKDRDPNKLNSHLNVDFYSVLAEPSPKPRSFDCVWEFSELCYGIGYDCIYTLLSTLCGCWIAMFWGLQMVPPLFTHIWIFTPCTTLVKMVFGTWGRICCLIMARTCISPWTKACAPLFRHCGNGLTKHPKTPPIFPSGKRGTRPKVAPVVRKEEPDVVVVVDTKPDPSHFDDYDKEKIARSVRRQMMLV